MFNPRSAPFAIVNTNANEMKQSYMSDSTLYIYSKYRGTIAGPEFIKLLLFTYLDLKLIRKFVRNIYQKKIPVAQKFRRS